jgi:hypothetical protein
MISHPEVRNPIMIASQVTDAPERWDSVDFVADPALYFDNGTWHMLFEISEDNSPHAAVGHAVSSDGLSCEYDQIVLDDHGVAGVPTIWFDNEQSQYYMIASGNRTGKNGSDVILYEATEFPDKWNFVTNIDPHIDHHGDAISLKNSDGNYCLFITNFGD